MTEDSNTTSYSTELVSSMQSFPITVLLVDDQAIIAEAVRQMLEDQDDIIFHYCNDPSKAIKMANKVKPTVILQDLVMPEIDGLLLVRYFRANPQTKDIPMIVLSSKEEPLVKAEAFALGANDYMVKLPDKVEIIARIRYHSKAYIRLLERNEAYEKLTESQKVLNAELAEAAEYVKSLLPLPLEEDVTTQWCFIPSTQLGGDAFGYHWIDDDHFAIYLLDVCGHGVGAALLSITAINVLRSQTLPNTDFYDPCSVMSGLNEAFQMENHNYMFFTIWYGVFNKKTRKIVYSSGGHPPALLITGPTKAKAKTYQLQTSGIVIGGVEDAKFEKAEAYVDEYNQLFIYSDGVYELDKPDGTILQLNEFIAVVEEPSKPGIPDVERILRYGKNLVGDQPFQDDFSIVDVRFGPSEKKETKKKK